MRTHTEDQPYKYDVCPHMTHAGLKGHATTQQGHLQNNDTEKCNVKRNQIINNLFDPEKQGNVNAHLNYDRNIEKGKT